MKQGPNNEKLIIFLLIIFITIAGYFIGIQIYGFMKNNIKTPDYYNEFDI